MAVPTMLFALPAQPAKGDITMGNIKAMGGPNGLGDMGNIPFNVKYFFALAAFKVIMGVALVVVMGGPVKTCDL